MNSQVVQVVPLRTKLSGLLLAGVLAWIVLSDDVRWCAGSDGDTGWGRFNSTTTQEVRR